MLEGSELTLLLPHHEQQPLCTTRLPYRQGRKLTAVKVYTVVNESNHLLIFGVPSLNLRQEAKALFHKFGKLINFYISKKHVAEEFTETYHASYDKIQSARLAKRFTDTKNFYGGCLHVCYAPEYESVQETRSKLLQRKQDILFRIRKLQNQGNCKETYPEVVSEHGVIDTSITVMNSVKLNMGEVNTILVNNEWNKKRKKMNNDKVGKRFKTCVLDNIQKLKNNNMNTEKELMEARCDGIKTDLDRNVTNVNTGSLEIIDCTSTEIETVTNINESLNYRNFGNEVVKKIQQRPINRIKFNIRTK